MNVLRCLSVGLVALVAGLPAANARAATLHVGAASCDITPDMPSFLHGSFSARVSTGVQHPLTANVLALESREGDRGADSAILISVDTCVVRASFLLPLREAIRQQLPEFDLGKLIVAATHTHTAPTTKDGAFKQQEGVQVPSEYVTFAVARIAAAVKQAWETRQPAKFAYGLGHAVVAYNRRAVYANGTAVMYGRTNDPNFRAVEGMEDHDVNSMFFWDASDKLLAIVVNVSCPSQEVEGLRLISSDFWGPTRESLKEKYGQDVTVLGLCGAAGDQSPHLRYRQAADDRMTKLRNLDRLQEIARRIVHGVDEAYEAVQNVKQDDVVVKHQSAVVQVPERIVTEAEYQSCKAEVERLKANPGDGRGNWNARVVARYERLKTNPAPLFPTPVNVLRIGDAVLCTNQFELYTDFGVQMKARSKAVQTFVVQLANGAGKPQPPAEAPPEDKTDWHYSSSGTYLPSERAVQGGGYGAVIQSNTVGPEGGQVLVEETLKMINAMF
ncbi:MAG: hypothetical protein GX575_16015 [Candidatus Anammoximicrobium sp.]|nr:hypothetical protein [Candidatus Anammoximicrobium sp.]